MHYVTIQSHLDYCCQLWCPSLLSEKDTRRNIQKSFLNKIQAYDDLNCQETLKRFGLHSLERRRERYFITFAWRMLENHVLKIGVMIHISIHYGRLCKISPYLMHASAWVIYLKKSSFIVRGTRLFLCAPRNVRDITSKDGVLKTVLDYWLASLPDELHIPGYTAQRRATTNSIKDMCQWEANQGDPGKESQNWNKYNKCKCSIIM